MRANMFLCEKPIAMAARDIDRLIAKRDETGLLAAEAFMIVHHPQWQRVRTLLAAGEIGALRRADVAFSFDNGAARDDIRNRPETGGGALGDIGVYAFGSVRFATGQGPARHYLGPDHPRERRRCERRGHRAISGI